jgi:hypothetical protein
VTASLLAVLLLQVVLWMFCTHLQSRFLLPAAIPLCLLIGLGSQGLGETSGSGGLAVGVLAILITAVVGVQALCCAFLLLPEADLLGGTVARAGKAARIQPIGILPGRNLTAEFEGLETLPPASRPRGTILLVGDAAPLWYEDKVLYATVFDRHPLAEALRRGGPTEAVGWLRGKKVNYVVVNWREIERLRKSYGFDDAITPDAIAGLKKAGLEEIAFAPGRGVVTVLRVAERGLDR